MFIFGRQPAIGRAELESLYGADHLAPLGNVAAVSDLDPSQIDFARLGSSVKLAAFMGTVSGPVASLHQSLEKMVLQQAQDIAEGKIQLGISAYDIKTSPKQLMAFGWQY